MIYCTCKMSQARASDAEISRGLNPPRKRTSKWIERYNEATAPPRPPRKRNLNEAITIYTYTSYSSATAIGCGVEAAVRPSGGGKGPSSSWR